MKEIAWVFGGSASGKETFINAVLNDEELQQRLGWHGKQVAGSQASIEYIGQSQDDPVVDSRDRIITEVPNLLEEVDVVLIKWQIVDSRDGRIRRLSEAMPGIIKKAIYLNADIPEQEARLGRKPWWNDNDDKGQFLVNEAELTTQALKELPADFEIIRLDSTTPVYPLA